MECVRSPDFHTQHTIALSSLQPCRPALLAEGHREALVLVGWPKRAVNRAAEHRDPVIPGFAEF
jgi:hypothetical protein